MGQELSPIYLHKADFHIASSIYSISGNCIRETTLWPSGKSIGLVLGLPGINSQ